MNAVHDTIELFGGLSSVERLGWILLHSVWQEALIAILLGTTLACMRRRSASARYLVCCAAILLMIALPLLTAALAVTAARVPAHGTAPMGWGHRLPAVAHPEISLRVPQNDARPRVTGMLHSILRSLSYCWLLGVVALSLWHLIGWLAVQRLKRVSVPAPAALQQKLVELAGRLRVAFHVGLRICDRVGAPAVVGWLRPVVLVPTCALTGLVPSQLEALLLHELAHIRRHDYLFNLLQTAAETLLFYHPAVWWVGRKIRGERENCCDDIAAAHSGGALRYARSLAAMEVLRAAMAPALAMGSDGGNLLSRIERLVSPPVPRSRRSRPFALGMVATLAWACIWLAGNRGNAHAADTAPATRVAASPAQLDGILPEDLVVDRSDYAISPKDQLKISLANFNGSGKHNVMRSQVSESGTITLPMLPGKIVAAGRTESQLELDIVKAYHDHHLSARVSVLEPHGRQFSILGLVARPGEYVMVESDFRLRDAIASAAGTTGAVVSIRIYRRAPGEARGTPDHGHPRMINIAPDRLLGNGQKRDPHLNLLVRPGDFIYMFGPVVRPASVRSVTLIVGKDSLVFQGKNVTWEQMPDLLRNLPARQETVLALAAQSDEVTVGRYFNAEERAGALVWKFGLKYLTRSTVETTKPATQPAR